MGDDKQQTTSPIPQKRKSSPAAQPHQPPTKDRWILVAASGDSVHPLSPSVSVCDRAMGDIEQPQHPIPEVTKDAEVLTDTATVAAAEHAEEEATTAQQAEAVPNEELSSVKDMVMAADATPETQQEPQHLAAAATAEHAASGAAAGIATVTATPAPLPMDIEASHVAAPDAAVPPAPATGDPFPIPESQSFVDTPEVPPTDPTPVAPAGAAGPLLTAGHTHHSRPSESAVPPTPGRIHYNCWQSTDEFNPFLEHLPTAHGAATHLETVGIVRVHTPAHVCADDNKSTHLHQPFRAVRHFTNSFIGPIPNAALRAIAKGTGGTDALAAVLANVQMPVQVGVDPNTGERLGRGPLLCRHLALGGWVFAGRYWSAYRVQKRGMEVTTMEEQLKQRAAAAAASVDAEADTTERNETQPVDATPGTAGVEDMDEVVDAGMTQKPTEGEKTSATQGTKPTNSEKHFIATEANGKDTTTTSSATITQSAVHPHDIYQLPLFDSIVTLDHPAASEHDMVAKFMMVCMAYSGHDLHASKAAREDWLYRNPLFELQGSVVPQWYGVYHAPQPTRNDDPIGYYTHVLMAVTEDAGVPIGGYDPERGFSDVLKLCVKDRQAILDKYDKLHAAGVIHNSAKPKHWLLPSKKKPEGDGDGGKSQASGEDVRLVDFGSAHVRPSCTEHGAAGDTNNCVVMRCWARMVARERETVEETLKLGSWLQ